MGKTGYSRASIYVVKTRFGNTLTGVKGSSPPLRSTIPPRGLATICDMYAVKRANGVLVTWEHAYTLIHSDGTRDGEQFTEGKPATHVANQEFMSSALYYAKGTQIHGGGHYVNIVVEVIYLDSFKVTPNKRKSGQVDVGTNHNRVKFVALLVESYTHHQAD
jgi:hypothetical protein